jgi:hypothetical protein
MLNDLINVSTDALVLNPPERRREIVSQVKDRELKQIFDSEVIPKLEEIEAEIEKQVGLGIRSLLKEVSQKASTADKAETGKWIRKAAPKNDKKED